MKLFEFETEIPYDIVGSVKDYHLSRDPKQKRFDCNVVPGKVLHKDLTSLGWRFIAKGAFSAVYRKPAEPFVLKFNTRPDIGFALYARLIRKFNNTHFPVISDQKTIEVGEHRYFLYLVERLNKIPVRPAKKIVLWIKQCIRQGYFSEERDPAAAIESIRREYSPLFAELLTQQPDMFRAIQILKQPTNDMSYIGLDMHEGNIMQRKDGTIIFTDPYCNFDEVISSKL